MTSPTQADIERARTKWGDEAVEKVALEIKALVPFGYGMTADESRKYARAAIIATLDCLATPSEEMAKGGG